MPASNAIDIRGVSKTYGAGEGAVTAVRSASLSIRQNEFFTLLGPSGCGKTTLLRLIAGFEFPTGGEILLDGNEIGAMPPYRRPINTVFQNYALFPHMTVAENLGFGLKMLGRSRSEIEVRVGEMLKLVRMEKYGGRKTSQLSGGQQQRVALARALAPKPKVLLLDEPLSALDYKLRKEMQVELKRLQAETGITFVFVTHDQEEALTMSDRIAVMETGNLLQVGNPREIYDKPSVRFVADFIGESNFVTARLLSRDGAAAQAELPGGKIVGATAPSDFEPSGDVTLMLRPEHAALTTADNPEAVLSGTLEDIIYFGTDTFFDVKIASTGEIFKVRAQNKPSQTFGVEKGAAVGIRFEPGAARILRN